MHRPLRGRGTSVRCPGHDPVPPEVCGQQPRERGDHGAVGPAWRWAGDLAAQDGDLVPQHQDFRILHGIASHEQRQPAKQPDHEQADEANEHERRA